MTTPFIHSKIHISTDGLVFLRGGCHFGTPPLCILNSTVQLMILFFMGGPKWTPPILASVSMIVAKTIKELYGIY